MRTIFFQCLFLLAGVTGMAQLKQGGSLPGGQPDEKKAAIYIRSRVSKDRILLRWAPSDASTWKLANTYGYVIERFTVSRDNVLLKKPERITSKRIIRPAALKRWDSLIRKSDYAAIIAQALYGEAFSVSVNDSKGVAKFVNQTEELKQRFTMSLYAADQDFTAAGYAGLAWTDAMAKPNEKYLYRVFTLVPKTKRMVDTAMVVAGLDEYEPLPKPADIFAQFGDKSVLLAWDFDTYASFYNSYYIEKSADGGKTFSRASDLPVTRLNGKDTGSLVPGQVLYIDSLTDNTTSYTYRIQGISPFGEVGPYSEVITGKGKVLLAGTPNITGITFDKKGRPELNWDFEDSLNTLIEGFQISSAPAADGQFLPAGKLIRSSQRKILLDSIPSVAYLTITAVSKEGEGRTSNPYLVQAEDSEPPIVPQDFRGVIDTTGVVVLTWKPNTEHDLSGYKLYRTYKKGQEYSTLVDTVWRGTEFRDTLSLKDLNRKVYYTVAAVDTRSNQSAFAPVVEIKKPDVIAPTPAVFTTYEIGENEVLLQWINSADEDVQKHQLYRRELTGGTGQWEMVTEWTDKKMTRYTDKTKEGTHTYVYTLVAIDSSGLKSDPSNPLTVYVPAKREKQAIRKFDIEVDRDARKLLLNWVIGVPGVAQIELYRGEDKTPMSLYKVLDKGVTSFEDEDLRVNTTYKYGIRVLYSDGKNSDLKQKTIIY